MAKTIWTTNIDHDRLLAFVENPDAATDNRERPHIHELRQELARAKVVDDPAKVPANLITMRSRVRLQNLTTGKELECTLVYPNESNPDQQSISVLAPLGTAMLGHRTGDSFKVQLPRGETKFRVEAITYQPEAAGDTNL